MKKKIYSVLLLFIFLFFVGCNSNQYQGYTYEFDDSILNSKIYASDFDISQLQLKIIDNNNVIGYMNVDEGMVNNNDFAVTHKPGSYVITIKYQNYEHTFNITLLDDVIEYRLDETNLKKQYYINEFDISSLRIKVVKNGIFSEYINVTKDMISNEDIELLNTTGTHNITINYQDYVLTFTITILEDVIEYEIDDSVLNKEYYVGEFDISNLRIKVIKNGIFSEYINVTKDMISNEDIELLKTKGTHNITIKYNTYEYTFSITILEHSEDVLFYSDNEYYSKANGYTGEQLKSILRTIISVTKKAETYGELRTDLAKTDADPNNPNNIILIYTGLSVSSKWDSGRTWNREHIWPQSLGWFKETGAGADLHHIRPANPSENTSRGNKRYGSQTNNKFYEPRDEVKGDIARIIFYLMVRYKEADYYTFNTVAESKELLLSWNIMDPVDEFEMKRNELIYSIQGNRNPFVDNPECAEMIWGTVEVNNIDYEEGYIVNIIYYIDDKKNRTIYSW